MEEYRALREKMPILEMMKDPAIATEVTLQPINAFPVDAAIIFADILTLPEAMGLNLEFIPGKGPVFHNPIQDMSDVQKLRPLNAERDLDFTLEAIRMTRAQLSSDIPLIGFSGAPFTLACYAVEGSGSKNFDEVRAWMYNDPDRWAALMDRLTDGVLDYLQAQIDAGAQALQLFDSWAGCLPVQAYERFAAPWTRKIMEGLGDQVPRIHFAANGGHLLEVLADLPLEVIGVDWRQDPRQVIKRVGTQHVLQGNLDPALLLAGEEALEEALPALLDSYREAKGHIVNLGHGVIKTTKPERVAQFVTRIHELSRQA